MATYCRGLVVVGSPKTLSSDPIWRAWIRWVRDYGAFSTANALPLCSWESPDTDSVDELNVSDLRPIDEAGAGNDDQLHACCPQKRRAAGMSLIAYCILE